jgi:NADPH2:quinone reductase
MSMKAWRVHEFGEPSDALQLDEVEAPVAGPGEVLVRVAATTLNFNDVDGVRGRYRTVSPPLPYTPGMEVLGTVEGAGIGAEGWMGKRVVAIPGGAFGGYAEFAVGPSAMAFEMPKESVLPDSAAAAVYFPFHLSWLALHERAKVQPGETVLIHAAAGGVGSAAVQLANLAGARVIATAGSSAKLDLCRSLGAAVVINYVEDDFVEAVLRRRTAGVSTSRSTRLEARSRRRPSAAWPSTAATSWLASRRGSKPRTRASCRGRCCSGISRSTACATPTSTIRRP